VLNSIVLNLIWANSFGANRLFGRMRIGRMRFAPTGEYNSSDCHLVESFSLILPSLIIGVEFDCD